MSAWIANFFKFFILIVFRRFLKKLALSWTGFLNTSSINSLTVLYEFPVFLFLFLVGNRAPYLGSLGNSVPTGLPSFIFLTFSFNPYGNTVRRDLIQKSSFSKRNWCISLSLEPFLYPLPSSFSSTWIVNEAFGHILIKWLVKVEQPLLFFRWIFILMFSGIMLSPHIAYNILCKSKDTHSSEFCSSHC